MAKAVTQESPREIPILSRLAPPEGAVRPKKRVGRGPGSGLGKTSGRGQKGQKARSTGQFGKLMFEGGQSPLQRRMPKVGFDNPFARQVTVVNIRDLKRFDSGATVDLVAFRNSRLVRTKTEEVKVLGLGEIDRPLKVHAHAFSAEARRKIEAAGGSATLLPSSRKKAADPA